MNESIVIVEDDESIRLLLEVALSGNGYATACFDNAEDALAHMQKFPTDVAVFDIMLGGMTGVEAVRIMRSTPELKCVPVIMLTAKDTELDKILGLDAGADDYITKPFSILELCARVRSQLRRSQNTGEKREASKVLELNGLRLDNNVREVTLNGEVLPLTFKEFELLKLLMENRDRAISREELIKTLWGADYFGETRTLDIHIGALRQKLGDPAENSRYIKTVRGVGYRFIGGGE
ncbi:MAG: response regulator transcription factor [Oscillospiraceae bacterium]